MPLFSPSPLATVVVFAWPLIILLLFWRMPAHKAAGTAFILGYLYIPRKVTLLVPLLPNVDYLTMTPLAVALGVLFFGRDMLKEIRIGGMTWFLLLALFASDVTRVLSNGQEIRIAEIALAGLKPQTALTFILEHVLTVVVPFFLGAALGSRAEWTKQLILSWLTAGAIYMLLATLELKFSPQVNIWTYGYFQHSFKQMIREGGYRPIVYMSHGLEFSLFACGCALVALAARKLDAKVWGVGMKTWVIFFAVYTVLSKSLGALAFYVIGALLITRMKPKGRIRIATLLALLTLTYPIVRLGAWLPLDDIISGIAEYEPSRAASLQFRFQNEEAFLIKAAQKPWLGWGGFDRIRVYDPLTGRDLSTVDGEWIASVLSGGLFGFFAWFGVQLLPVLKAKSGISRRDVGPHLKELIATIAVINALLVLDRIPNGSFDSFAILFAGLVTGLSRTPHIQEFEPLFRPRIEHTRK